MYNDFVKFNFMFLLGDTTVYRSNGEWQILGAPGIRHVIMYLCCPEPYPDVTFYLKVKGAQWLSGRVLDSRPKGRGFEPHRRHCVVVLEQDTFILA